jgi:hypothetical protein
MKIEVPINVGLSLNPVPHREGDFRKMVAVSFPEIGVAIEQFGKSRPRVLFRIKHGQGAIVAMSLL